MCLHNRETERRKYKGLNRHYANLPKEMILELRLSTTSLKSQNFALELAQFTKGRGIKMNGKTQENSLNLQKKTLWGSSSKEAVWFSQELEPWSTNPAMSWN